MAEKTKTIAKTAVKTESSGGCMDYMSLRNVLDGVQYASLDYYACAKDDADRKRRATAIKAILMKAYGAINKLPNVKTIRNCYPCDEVCLPFKCPK